MDPTLKQTSQFKQNGQLLHVRSAQMVGAKVIITTYNHLDEGSSCAHHKC